jgi:1,4-alpha-glucan branching enzyme
MPGDEWQRFANLRLLLSYMYAHPGKKLLFMGCEFGQYNEWYHERSLDWHLLDNPKHKGVYELVKVLNGLYKEEKSFHQIDFANDGFAWIDHTDWQNSVATFLRRGQSTKEAVAVACNFTPTPRPEYRLGVPFAGTWKVIFNSDDKVWGGSGMVETKSVESEPVLCHGRENSIRVTLPPLGALFLRGRIKEKEQKKENLKKTMPRPRMIRQGRNSPKKVVYFQNRIN